MILDELKLQIEKSGTVSGRDLAKQFYLTEDGADAMLNVLINKGQVSRLIDTNKANHVTRIRYSLANRSDLAMTVMM
ncbi:FeoC-like transcriptional regulator [Vibrio profundi]|uniref:FeoC-like transcriptional regulator n=1 Tax=Vibrio profundi TaxID=1774960 RepID=UPI0037355FB0